MKKTYFGAANVTERLIINIRTALGKLHSASSTLETSLRIRKMDRKKHSHVMVESPGPFDSLADQWLLTLLTLGHRNGSSKN